MAAARVLVVLVFTVWSLPAFAQTVPSECHAISPTERVVVTTVGGLSIRGSLVCLSEHDLLLAADGGVRRYPLDTVRRVVTPADPVWDGAAKGASIPLAVWAVLCHECGAEPMLRATVAYALIGLAFDALQTHRKVIYVGSPTAASVAWRVTF